MRNFQHYIGLFLVMALFTTSCALEDQSSLTVKGEDDLSFRNGKDLFFQLDPIGPKGIEAHIQLKLDDPYVQITGYSKEMKPGTTYYSAFYESDDCTGQINVEHIIIDGWEVNANGLGTINQTVILPIEKFRSLSIQESTNENPKPGELRSCGRIPF